MHTRDSAHQKLMKYLAHGLNDVLPGSVLKCGFLKFYTKMYSYLLDIFS